MPRSATQSFQYRDRFENLGIAASMSNSCRLLRCVRAWAAAALATAVLAGCQTLEVRNDLLDRPIPDAMVPPRELRKVSLPTYRIEPPDIVAIDMPKMVPLPPIERKSTTSSKSTSATP